MGNSESIHNDSSESVEVWWQISGGSKSAGDYLHHRLLPGDSTTVKGLRSGLVHQLCVKPVTGSILGESISCKRLWSPWLGRHTYNVKDILEPGKTAVIADSLPAGAAMALFALAVVGIKWFHGRSKTPAKVWPRPLAQGVHEPLLGTAAMGLALGVQEPFLGTPAMGGPESLKAAVGGTAVEIKANDPDLAVVMAKCSALQQCLNQIRDEETSARAKTRQNPNKLQRSRSEGPLQRLQKLQHDAAADLGPTKAQQRLTQTQEEKFPAAATQQKPNTLQRSRSSRSSRSSEQQNPNTLQREAAADLGPATVQQHLNQTRHTAAAPKRQAAALQAPMIGMSVRRAEGPSMPGARQPVIATSVRAGPALSTPQMQKLKVGVPTMGVPQRGILA
jgi:hypothetical protein